MLLLQVKSAVSPRPASRHPYDATMAPPRAARLLENALTEYLVDKYSTADQWTRLGTQTDTRDTIRNHPRLLRSLSFGDEDYPEAIADVVPKIMQAFDRDTDPWGLSQDYDLGYMADVFPDLMNHFRNANPRMYQRFVGEFEDLPDAWRDGQVESGSPLPIAVTAQPPTAANGGLSTVSTAKAPEVPTVDAPLREQQTIFLAHGRDEGKREIVRAYVHQIAGIMPTILDSEVNGGQTIIEKFERHADASSVAIILLTPDDTGALSGEAARPRARQNVIYEMGYFVGRLGRSKVIAINDGVETPSDISGLLYIGFEGDWKERLRGELRAAGVPIEN